MTITHAHTHIHSHPRLGLALRAYPYRFAQWPVPFILGNHNSAYHVRRPPARPPASLPLPTLVPLRRPLRNRLITHRLIRKTSFIRNRTRPLLVHPRSLDYSLPHSVTPLTAALCLRASPRLPAPPRPPNSDPHPGHAAYPVARLDSIDPSISQAQPSQPSHITTTPWRQTDPPFHPFPLPPRRPSLVSFTPSCLRSHLSIRPNLAATRTCLALSPVAPRFKRKRKLQ